ncbi:FAD-dependent oxidoreductase [Pseudonocardia dioxanivorans]|uniref:FAD-dependent oxidoreductase n=1 Tax=Pseudonocardia dioxanivorans TaxID=240495 RepID=UPI000301E56B|nr:FAD-dependent oxidoreductase [Pseudonocardia dioxanivorans]
MGAVVRGADGRHPRLDRALARRLPGARHRPRVRRPADPLVVGERRPRLRRDPPQARIIPDLRAVDPAAVPAGFTSAARATMPLVDMPVHLPYLVRRAGAAGVTFSPGRVGSPAAATREWPVVVNCAGLGARELAADPTVYAALGQHVVLADPGLEELLIELTTEPEWVSVFPHGTRVVCGGIRRPGVEDTTPDPTTVRRILDRCVRAVPALADAEILGTPVGLRPERPSVRVEAERLGSALVVHDYGHGGNGVSLSWGCAARVRELVEGVGRTG